MEVPYVDLAHYTNGRKIDVLKLDIEGSEFEFCRSNADLLRSVGTLVAEVHHQAGSFEELAAMLTKADLFPVGQPSDSSVGQLALFHAA